MPSFERLTKRNINNNLKLLSRPIQTVPNRAWKHPKTRVNRVDVRIIGKVPSWKWINKGVDSETAGAGQEGGIGQRVYGW